MSVMISRPGSFDDIAKGSSIACNGICLTVVSFTDSTFTIEVMAETITKSNARFWQAGTKLNLERAMKIGSRLDGHWVQGHVDSTSTLMDRHDERGTTYLRFHLCREHAGLVAPQGSIAINGVSLTIARLDGNSFSVALISHTLENSNLSALRAGTEVNLEYDIVGKYLLRQNAKPQMTMEWLHEQGF